MPSYKDLVDELKSADTRYRRLKSKFDVLKEVRTALVHVPSPVNSIDITDIDDVTFSAAYLDRTTRIHFHVDYPNSSGVVTATLMPSFALEIEQRVFQFTFRGDGVTDIPTNDPNDPYYLDHQSDSVSILLMILAAAIKVTPLES